MSYLGFTATQESVFASAGPGGFRHGGAVTLVTTLVYGILAFLERVKANEHFTRKGAWRDYFVLAALTSSGMYATNAALRKILSSAMNTTLRGSFCFSATILAIRRGLEIWRA